MTRRLGVLGWPVAHSRSPAMHRAALDAAGLTDWTYQHLPVPPELFEETVRALPGSGFVGANVTIPHKEAAAALADARSEAVEAIGAANTLTFDERGIAADNTDAPAIVAACGDVAGRATLVLGAGGSALAAAHGLREAGAEVLVWNRTAARAKELAARLGVAVWGGGGADVAVNCTAVGLRPDDAPEVGPLDAGLLRGLRVLVDLPYGEHETPLAAAARAAGVPTVVDGREILVRQGALSFERWTGRPADLEAMRVAVA